MGATMYLRSKTSIPQFRRAMLTSVSALTLCLSTTVGASADSLTIEAEGSWQQHFGDEVTYAVSRTLTPFSDVNETVDRDEDYAGRGQVIWHLNDVWSISGGGGFADFSGDATAPSADLFDTFIFTQVATVPDLVAGLFCGQLCEQVYSDGSANLDTDIEFYDFDVGADVGIGRNGTARFFVGVRYVRFDETLRASFSNFSAYYGYQNQMLSTTRVSKFEGWGPRVGFTADVPIGTSGFSFGGTVAFAALFGDIDSTTRSTHASTFTGPTNFGESSSRSKTAYSVEVAPQVSYTLKGESISARISAGYRFDHYLGIVDTATRQAIIATPPSGESTDDAKFDGPFLRVGVKFGGENAWAKP